MRTVIGVMGGAEATPAVAEAARRVGALIAGHGWVLLNGGRAAGVMEASARGAHEAGGLVVGVLGEDDLAHASRYVDIPLPTGLGDGRNFVNVTASRVVIALPGGAGTLSEVALALKQGKTVVTLLLEVGPAFDAYAARGQLLRAESPEAAIALVERTLADAGA